MQLIVAYVRPERVDAVRRELRGVALRKLAVVSACGGPGNAFPPPPGASSAEERLRDECRMDIVVDEFAVRSAVEAVERGAGDGGCDLFRQEVRTEGAETGKRHPG